jgi:hypothetical protein
VQQTQENCWPALAFLVLGTLLGPTLADAAAGRPKPDALLTEAKGPCNPGLDGPEYVAGTDADGNPVAPADLPHEKVPVPQGILQPLNGQSGKGRAGRQQAYAVLSQKNVDSILDSKPACPPEHRAHGHPRS